jgi:Tfp pilus assembly protein PilF/predicted small secreted protein
MKTKTIVNLSLVVVTAAVLASCNGLGKMVKKQATVTYDVKTNPLEMHGDSVFFTVTGKYPAKYFAKKATVTVTPVVKYTGGEKALKPVVLVGESATGSGQKISYEKGGTFSYTSEKFAYETAMKVAKVELRAQGTVKKKIKDFTPLQLADGTIITPLLVRNDEKGIYAKDAFVKVIPSNQIANIFYLVNSSDVRSSELKSAEMKNIQDFITKNINSSWYEFKNISISAYASPDGELSLNENLAKDRAKSGSKALMNEFKKNKNKEQKFGKEEANYTTQTTAEDWEGFKSLMEQSSIADKDLILRVLSMYSDLEQREKEIKNLSKTYTEVADKILPQLRRSVLTLNVDKKSRTDEMISKLAISNPDSLSVEELLYAGALTNDINTKVQIYTSAEKQFGNDWRTSNNLGVALLAQNKVSDAGAAFDRAAKNANGNAIVMNHLGIIEAKKGNRTKAMEYYDKANGAGKEVAYNKGILNVRDAKYADAVSNFGDYKGFNKALAELLNGNAGTVASVIDESNEKDMAMSYYLKALASARNNNATDAVNQLKTAIEKDGSLKAAAKDDAEFIKMRDNTEFKSLVN